MHSVILGRLQGTSLLPIVYGIELCEYLVFCLKSFAVGVREFLLVRREFEFLSLPLRS